jgi:nucleotide-binding universal stress UspA family protein
MVTATRILVAHDFGERSEAANRYALTLASALGATVDLLRVSETTHLANPFRQRPRTRRESAGTDIMRAASDRGADLIVMGTHGRSLLGRTTIGSTARTVRRSAPCPVLTVGRPQHDATVSSILVAVDFTAVSRLALEYGRELCRSLDARLHVLHVMENPFLRPMVMDPHVLATRTGEQLDAMLTETDRRALRATATVRMSDAPAAAIVEYAARTGVDLIVVGTHRRRRLERLLIGSVAERVSRTAACPVLSVHQSDSDSRILEALTAAEHHGIRAVDPRTQVNARYVTGDQS